MERKFANELIQQDYGPQWRTIRKIVHANLNIKAARSYVPYQDLENKVMLMGMLEAPERFVDHIRRCGVRSGLRGVDVVLMSALGTRIV
jgi:gentisate 1,2-dioxygenase